MTITLTREPTKPGDLPRLMPLTGAIGARDVLVIKENRSQLKAGDWVVLTTGKGKPFELTSRAARPGAADQDGTYVDVTILRQVGDDVDRPTLRLYNRADVVKKITSSAGRLLAGSTALAVVTAFVGFWFAVAGDSGPSPSAAAAKATTLLAWATKPELQIQSSANPNQIAAARNALDRRQRKVNACLEGLQGGDGAPPSVDGIACSTPSPSFIRNKDSAAPIVAGLGIVAALLAGIGSATQFAAGKTPAS